MALLEALAVPVGKRLFAALVKGDSTELAALPGDVLQIFFGEILAGVDAQAAQLTSIERKIDMMVEQDFARDFDAALAAMRDALRARSEVEVDANLREAWTRLRSAAAGTQNQLRKADALYVAAIVAIQRHRPEDAIDRAQAAWITATASLLADFQSYQYPNVPVDSTRAWLRRSFASNAEPEPSARIDSATRCVAACRRSDEASLLLGALKQNGHPVGFHAKPEKEWFGVNQPSNTSPMPSLTLVGGRVAQIPTGATLSYVLPCPPLTSRISPEYGDAFPVAARSWLDDLGQSRRSGEASDSYARVVLSDSILGLAGGGQASMFIDARYVNGDQILQTGALRPPRTQFSVKSPRDRISGVTLGPPDSHRWIEILFGNFAGTVSLTPWTVYLRIA